MSKWTTDVTQIKLEKRQAELSKNSDSMEKALKKLARLVGHIDRLRIERKRLLKPPTPAEAKLKVTGEEMTKIRHIVTSDDLCDDIGF